MKTIFAVAKQTLLQCLRMKTALGVLVLLALTLIFMPNMVSGDGSLAGKIRSLISYGIGMSTLLLAIFTLLVTVSIVTEDIRNKTIILIVVKPISRWKYLLGRWLGIVLLDLILCALTFTGVYLGVLFLRDMTPENAQDRTAIETEIFTARKILFPRMKDYRAATLRKIEKLKKESPQQYNKRLELFRNEHDWRKRTLEERLYQYYYNQIMNKNQVRDTGESFRWIFDNLDLSNATITQDCELFRQTKNQFVFTASNEILAKLRRSLPIYVNEVKVAVTNIGPTAFEVSFTKTQFDNPQIQKVLAEKKAKIRVTPVCQLRYKPQIINQYDSNEGYIGAFKYGVIWGGYSDPKNPNSSDEKESKPEIIFNAYDREEGIATINSVSEINILPEYLGDKNSIFVQFYNLGSGYSSKAPDSAQDDFLTLRIPLSSVQLMVPVESFTSNYIKAVILIFLQLAFLATLGIFFSTFLSFPVSMIACSVFLLGGILFGSIEMSVYESDFANQKNVFTALSQISYSIIKFVMPDISAMTPSDKLANGILISWSNIFSLGGINAVCRGLFYLLIGCGIFYKREISQVQV